MSEIAYAPVTTVTEEAGNFISRAVQWINIKAGDTCKEFKEAAAFPNSRVHVFGVWGGAHLFRLGLTVAEAEALVAQV